MYVVGDNKVVIATHVDGAVWGSKPGYKHMASSLLEKPKNSEKSTFRFCGREMQQFMFVICRIITHMVESIIFQTRRKQGDEATPAEISQLCIAAGSVRWVAWQCRPDPSFQVSKLQAAMWRAKVKDLIVTSRTVRDCVVGPKRGLRHPSGQLSWVDMTI